MSLQDDLEADLTNVFIDATEFALSGTLTAPDGTDYSVDYVGEALFFSPETTREEARFRFQGSTVPVTPAGRAGWTFTDADSVVWAVAQVRDELGEILLLCFSQNPNQ